MDRTGMHATRRRGRPLARRARRPLLAGLVMALLCLVIPYGTPAASADESTYLRVELTSVTPTVLTSSGDLVVEGRITNTSGAPITGAEVRLWRDATPIDDEASLDRALSDTQPLGATMESDGARVLVADGGTLADGESADFTVQASLDPNADESLWLTPSGAAYQVGVEVFGTASVGGYQLLGRSAALMAYPDDTTVSVSTVVVLASRPTLLPLDSTGSEPATFVDASLLGELANRLSDLMRLAEQPGVTTVIDPALFDEVTALAAGFRVQLPDGTLRDGTPQESALAAAWLARLQALQDDGTLYRGLYGSPDVTAAVSAGRTDVLLRAAAALTADHPLAGLPLVVVPTDYEVDTATLDALKQLDPTLVLAGNATGDDGVLHTRDGLRVVSVAADIADGGPGDDATTPAQVRGRLLAQQLVTAKEGSVAVSVVTTSAQAALEAETVSWRNRVGLAELTGSDAVTTDLELEPVSTVPETGTLASRTDAVAEAVAAWGELRADDDSEHRLNVMTATAWSGVFGRDEDAQVAWLDRMAGPTTVLRSDAIQVHVSDWVTTSEDDNQLPVTVINTTDEPVTVKVHFESENPLRISVADSDLVEVEPGESATVRVSPRTSGNGKVAITAQLVTEGGHPVGSQAAFVITGTEAGRVAWLIIVGSGAVLLIATALRIRQVRRERRQA
ncbi:DUF6049 family protein [Brooklawnia cerclae]|uniref:Glycoprotein n=1 Tax=Brooklawnia cerclae TaxID=349934 RepID=A0ABX0SJU9_9ACTN|nr:hypothetical protein [Brooklawnia cerclae]